MNNVTIVNDDKIYVSNCEFKFTNKLLYTDKNIKVFTIGWNITDNAFHEVYTKTCIDNTIDYKRIYITKIGIKLCKLSNLIVENNKYTDLYVRMYYYHSFPRIDKVFICIPHDVFSCLDDFLNDCYDRLFPDKRLTCVNIKLNENRVHVYNDNKLIKTLELSHDNFMLKKFFRSMNIINRKNKFIDNNNFILHINYIDPKYFLVNLLKYCKDINEFVNILHDICYTRCRNYIKKVYEFNIHKITERR